MQQNEYLLAKIGVDTAENEPLKGHLIVKLLDSIFADPSPPPKKRFVPKLRDRTHQARAVGSKTCPFENIRCGIILNIIFDEFPFFDVNDYVDLED